MTLAIAALIISTISLALAIYAAHSIAKARREAFGVTLDALIKANQESLNASLRFEERIRNYPLMDNANHIFQQNPRVKL